MSSHTASTAAVRPGPSAPNTKQQSPAIHGGQFFAPAGDAPPDIAHPRPQRRQFFPPGCPPCTSGCSKVVPMAPETARRWNGLPHVSPTIRKCAPKAAQFRTTAPRFSALAMPSTAASSIGATHFSGAFQNPAAAGFWPPQRALMQLVAVMVSSSFCRRHKRKSRLRPARSSGSTFPPRGREQRGDDGVSACSSRLTTLAFVATSTLPARVPRPGGGCNTAPVPARREIEWAGCANSPRPLSYFVGDEGDESQISSVFEGRVRDSSRRSYFGQSMPVACIGFLRIRNPKQAPMVSVSRGEQKQDKSCS